MYLKDADVVSYPFRLKTVIIIFLIIAISSIHFCRQETPLSAPSLTTYLGNVDIPVSNLGFDLPRLSPSPISIPSPIPHNLNCPIAT